MKKVFEVVKGREVDLEFFLNLSLKLACTNFGERLQVVFNGVPDGVFFKFEWVEGEKKC